MAEGAGSSRRTRWRRVLAGFAGAAALAIVAAAGGAFLYYQNLRSEVAQHDLGEALEDGERPDKLNDALTILLIGSDDREETSGYGGSSMEGERSDALLLVHISPDNDEVTAVSFPRDSLVQLPECDPYDDTEGTSGYYGMINAALFHGGPPCVVKTVESLTGIHIDHFAQMDFEGFRDMVDAVGGVEMCVPEPMEDERAHLELEAGEQTLDGEESLAFVRARYGIGDGGDRGRIDRQQMFLGALADEVTSDSLLVRPDRVRALLDAVAEHVTTDTDLTLPTMMSVGSTLNGMDMADINFYTVPAWQAPSDPNRVVWNEELAAELFDSVAHDEPVDAALLQDGGAEPPDGDDEPTPAYPAEEDEEEEPLPDSEPVPGELVHRDATANPCDDGLGTGTEDDR